MRRAWTCLIQKRWLFLYPLATTVFSCLFFFAVYAAQGDRLTWSAFFTAYYDRDTYLHDQFITEFSFTLDLWVPIAAAIGFYVVAALIQAPFFRAIVGHRYTLAPRSSREVAALFSFYFVLAVVTRLAPMAALTANVLGLLLAVVLLVIGIVVVFADYAIVFEESGPLRGVRRSLRLVQLRLGLVIVVVAAIALVYMLVTWLYGLYYEPGKEVFFLLPVSQILVESLVSLFATIFLVYLYEDLRRLSPARAKN